MALPRSYNAFTIPSLYDDIELQCRLYFPRRKVESDSRFVQGFGIFAHPYAPLGGSYEDPIVNLVGSILLKQGFILVTFNFRGAEGSAGHTSWSGKPELADYVSIVAFVLCFIQSSGVLDYTRTSPSQHAHSPWLILGGYSYGSMIASHVPRLEVIRTLMNSAIEGSTEYEILNRAQDLSKVFLGYVEALDYRGRSSLRAADAHSPTSPNLSMGGYESQSAGQKINRESSRRSIDIGRVRHSVERVRNKLGHRTPSDQTPDTIQTSSVEHGADNIPRVAHLLVSPILGFVSGLTTVFQKLEFEPRGTKSRGPSSVTDLTVEERLTRSPTFAVYGTKDSFTSVRKLRDWSEDLSSMPASCFTSQSVSGAGHFWNEPGVESQLVEAITGWISTKVI